MSLQHRKEDFVRAILEGVAMGINQFIRIFREGGAEPVEIRACGGQASSNLWNQIKADVTGLPVKVPLIHDGELLGMALIAGKGAGIFASIKDAAERLVKISREFTPDPVCHRHYAGLQQVYEGLYPSLKDHFASLWALNARGCDMGECKDGVREKTQSAQRQEKGTETWIGGRGVDRKYERGELCLRESM